MSWLKALRSHSFHYKSEPIELQAGLHVKSRPDFPEVSHVQDILVDSKPGVHNFSKVENTLTTTPQVSPGNPTVFPSASLLSIDSEVFVI